MKKTLFYALFSILIVMIVLFGACAKTATAPTA